MPEKPTHLHFLGMAGHAMSALALAAREQGYHVTGTDPGAKPPATDFLDQHGLRWFDTSDAQHLDHVDQVIISGHTPVDDVEVAAAQARGIPIVSFAEFVGGLTRNARTIVVAGTHGKTTTTSLVTWILECAGLKPDYLIGIKPHNFPSSVRLRGSSLAVLEGDEYRASQLSDASKFEYYHPDVLVVTGIEMDHPDFFSSFAHIKEKFRSVIKGLPADGRLIYSPAVPGDIATLIPEKAESYASASSSDQKLVRPPWTTGESIQFTPEGLRFTLRRGDTEYGELVVPLYGQHNILNSVAAAAVAIGEGVPFSDVQAACQTFQGASRRFSMVSAPQAAVRVVDDYAHHPTEVATTIEAAKLHFPGRVLAVFRPHTYTRTKELLKEYAVAFDHADQAFIAPIEGAREADLAATVSSDDLASEAPDHVRAYADRASLVEAVGAAAGPGDTILCMTVSGYDQLAEELAAVTSRSS